MSTVTFILETWGGQLEPQNIATGNTQKYYIDGQLLLDQGVVWETAGIAVTPVTVAATAEIGGAADDLKSYWFFVTAPVEGEKFTVTLTSTATDEQILVHTIDYLVFT